MDNPIADTLFDQLLAEWKTNKEQNTALTIQLAKLAGTLHQFDKQNIDSMLFLPVEHNRTYNLICNRSIARSHFSSFNTTQLVQYFQRLDSDYLMDSNEEIRQEEDRLFLKTFEELCSMSDNDWEKYQVNIILAIEAIMRRTGLDRSFLNDYYYLVILIEATKLHEMGYSLLEARKVNQTK